MENEMNIYEKIHYVQRSASAGDEPSDGEALAATLARLRPHLDDMKLVVMFSDDVESCAGTAFVRSTVTAINVEAPYDRTACTAYEPLRTASEGESRDATISARRNALEGLFALGSSAARGEAQKNRASAKAGQKAPRVEPENTARVEPEETTRIEIATKPPKVKRTWSDDDLARANEVQVKIPGYGGMRIMNLGSMTTKQLEYADSRYGWLNDIHSAIEIVMASRES